MADLGRQTAPRVSAVQLVALLSGLGQLGQYVARGLEDLVRLPVTDVFGDQCLGGRIDELVDRVASAGKLTGVHRGVDVVELRRKSRSLRFVDRLVQLGERFAQLCRSVLGMAGAVLSPRATARTISSSTSAPKAAATPHASDGTSRRRPASTRT